MRGEHFTDTDWFSHLRVLAVFVVASFVLILILFFLTRPVTSNFAIYFSSNDVNDISITNKITFTFVVENHFNADKNIPFEVLLDENVLTSGTMFAASNQKVEQMVSFDFNKNSFKQRKVSVVLTDTNQDIFFNAGLQTHATFQNNLALVKASVLPVVVKGDQNITLDLWWTALAKTDENFVIFVHFLDVDDKIAFQLDHSPIVDGNVIETSQWKEDEILKEHFVERIPAGTPDGNYNVVTGFYVPGSPRVKTKQNEDYAYVTMITVTK